ncbi:DNA ligase [Cohnella silvisoli]|uniref:DNA ligase (ATP) n=1 Tax=Cohnella silvisoli TaxID=2873699 RepID=A0ABV1KV90_9BACL|nr:DNA ligase [Cohnella silvisoli]MCD9023297.1 DNA ligase [Cohnella silvisoli]
MKPIIPFEPIRAAHVPEGKQWIYQIKWDGVRILSYYDGTSIKLYNRKKNERTCQFPELTTPDYCSAQSFILDGEVIALAADGKPSFHEVMRRDGIRRLERVPLALKEVPITYMIFDVVYFNDEWMNNRSLRERQQLLQDIVIPSPTVQLVASHLEGNTLFDVIRQQSMEGILCKDLNSTYAIDGKDDRWVKVKNYGDVIAVIGGFTLNGGIVNSLLAGLYENGKLYFIGKVGTGKLSAADWRELTVTLKSIEVSESPFAIKHPDMRGAYWARPLLTARIQFAEWRIQEGRTMRQPSIQAFVDVLPDECVFE